MVSPLLCYFSFDPRTVWSCHNSLCHFFIVKETQYLCLFPDLSFRALSHLPHLVWTFGLFSLIRIKITGVKPRLDHSPDQTAEPWSDEKRWSWSGSNWTIVRFVSSVKTIFGWFGHLDQLQEVLAGYRQNRKKEKISCGNTWGEEDQVFNWNMVRRYKKSTGKNS